MVLSDKLTGSFARISHWFTDLASRSVRYYSVFKDRACPPGKRLRLARVALPVNVFAAGNLCCVTRAGWDCSRLRRAARPCQRVPVDNGGFSGRQGASSRKAPRVPSQASRSRRSPVLDKRIRAIRRRPTESSRSPGRTRKLGSSTSCSSTRTARCATSRRASLFEVANPA